ncbi:DUF6415 family natural product biosynthesis protein [Streptomyces sp. NPDC020898]|uniref:DUF6415 family natural product biosynthesis protein n=1 Tax=Streptomyces sp. NPDC020898 TaxID=3365101 RepID=UPI00378D3354
MLTLTLKGHLALVIPEVDRVASARRGEDTFARADARMAIAETCRKLRFKPSPALSAHIAYARRLSRSLNALCDHYEQLCGAHLGVDQRASEEDGPTRGSAMKDGQVWVGDQVYDHDTGKNAIVTDVQGGTYLLRPLCGGGQPWTVSSDQNLSVGVPRSERPE